MMIAIVYLFRFGGVWLCSIPFVCASNNGLVLIQSTPSISGGKYKRGRGKRRIIQDIHE